MNASTGKFCAYCKAEIQGGERIIVCPSCLAIHHENCWNEHKGCSTAGCIYHYQEVPTTPAEPVAPAAPVEPVAPTAPIEAFAPLAPVEPVAPAAPIDPVVPTTPAEPVAPAAPVDPVAPAAPIEAFAPLAPVEPVAPAAPIESVAPAAPVEPIIPAAPVEPVVPAASIEAFAPLAPVEPVAPTAPVEPVAPTTPSFGAVGSVCTKCGATLNESQMFCTACGEKAALHVESSINSAIDQFNSNIDNKKKKSKNKVIIPVAIGAAVTMLIILIAIFSGPSVDSITLSNSDFELLIGKTVSASYTVEPAESQSKVEVTWTSSNSSVATVSSTGTITAVGEGTCIITVTAKGKSDSLSVVVIKGPDFNEFYDKYCEYTWADVASDGSWLDIDTNPYNWDDDGVAYLDAYYAVENVIEALGLPSSLFDDIGETSYNDGRQTKYYDNVTVTWTYHPDQGLEITFKHPQP